MKKILASATIASFVATAASAGSLVEPEMEPMIEVVQEEPSSSGGLLVPLLALAAVAALVAGGSSTSTTGS